MKVIIAGGRGFNDYETLCKFCDYIIGEPGEEIEIVSGKAKGADTLGERYALDRNYKVKEVFMTDFIKDQFKNEFFYNLEVGFSPKYYLFQINDYPVSKKIFNDDYPFYTGKSNYMIKHFKDFSDWIKKNYLQSTSKIIEIGTNDGTFLKNFSKKNISHCGFEPSKKIAQIARKKGLNVISNFFNKKNANKLNKFKKKTDVVFAANVICHIPDLNDLIQGIVKLFFSKEYLGPINLGNPQPITMTELCS